MKQTKQTLYRSDLSTHKAIVSSFTKGAILSQKKRKSYVKYFYKTIGIREVNRENVPVDLVLVEYTKKLLISKYKKTLICACYSLLFIVSLP